MFVETILSTFCWHLYFIILHHFFETKMASTITSNTNVLIILSLNHLNMLSYMPYISIGYFAQNSYVVTLLFDKKDIFIYVSHHLMCMYVLNYMTTMNNIDRYCVENIFYYFESSNLVNYFNYYLLKLNYKNTIIMDLFVILQFIIYSSLRFIPYLDIYNCIKHINELFIFIYYAIYLVTIIISIRLFKKSIISANNIISVYKKY